MSNELQDQLLQKRRALRHLETQASQYGGKTNAPLHIWNQMDELAQEIDVLEQRLGIIRPPAPVYRQHIPSAAEHAQRIADEQRAAHQADIDHQMSMLRIYRRNLTYLQEQADAYGSLRLSPPIVRNQIDATRAGIAKAKRALAELGVDIETLPSDE